MRWITGESEIDLSGLSVEPRLGARVEVATFREPQEGAYFALVHPQRTALVDYDVILAQGLSPWVVTISLDASSVREDSAGNLGQTELLSPCPWANDGTCDEPDGLDICEVDTDPDCVCTFECGE
jgi:hypothetical protein